MKFREMGEAEQEQVVDLAAEILMQIQQHGGRMTQEQVRMALVSVTVFVDEVTEWPPQIDDEAWWQRFGGLG